MPTEDEILQEIEMVRLRVKRERMNNDLTTVPQMFSLWQETTDLLFRTNLGDDSRVEELGNLGRITFALTTEAYMRNRPRESLQKLQSVLRTLMPREWFQDRATHDSVAAAVHAANVEVQELYFSSVPTNREEPADAMESLHKLAMDLLEESRAYLQFRLGYGHDWNALRKRIPTHLRAMQIEAIQARDSLRHAQHELQQATEHDVWSSEWGTRLAKARYDDPDNLEATRTTLIAEMKQAVAVAEACLLQAKAAVLATEDERLEAERILAHEWREEHLPRLNGLIAGFRPQFERHRHKIGGLVDLSQPDLGELGKGASSACQILLTFAERVANSRQQTFQRLETDQLGVLVEREIGFLARSTSPESPTHPPSAIAAANGDSPPQQASVIPPPLPDMPVPAAHSVEPPPPDNKAHDVAGEWVPASFCVNKDIPDLNDHTAVRRFCTKHRIETRPAGGRRRTVHLPSFQTVLKAIKKKDAELGDIADRARTERERRARQADGR